MYHTGSHGCRSTGWWRRSLVQKYASSWTSSKLIHFKGKKQTDGRVPIRGAVVLVTGATGSLGSHIVQKLAENPTVA